MNAATARLETARDRARSQSQTWQVRRSKLLQEACELVATHVSDGVRLSDAWKRAARKYRNRSLGGGRQLALSVKSLTRLWYRWIKSRRESAAFALRYVGRQHREIDPILLRLVVSACLRESKSVSQILTEATAGSRAAHLNLSTLYRALPTPVISRFIRAERALLRRRKVAQQKLIAVENELQHLREVAERRLLESSDRVPGSAKKGKIK